MRPTIGDERGERTAVSIVVVSWNVRELLLGCLKSVIAEIARCEEASTSKTSTSPKTPSAGPFSAEVWVVDNASTDGSADAVACCFPRVHLIRNDWNPGFPAANNQAIRRCHGQAVLLLNPDTVMLRGSLGAMLRRLHADARVGVVGPCLLDPDGTVQPSRRRFPTLRTGLFESTIVQRHVPRAPTLCRFYVADRPDTLAQEVDWVHGACFLVRRAAWERVGLLDAGYTMYSEELDWQYRMRQRGWRVAYEPTARVVHHGGRSSEQVRPVAHVRFHESKYRYYALHRGRAEAAFLRWFILLAHIYQVWEEAAKLALRHKPELRRKRLALLARAISWHAGVGT